MTDDELVDAFEAGTLSALPHRDHVRLAFAYLRDADFGDGALRFRRALQAFACAKGAAGKYHETLTWLYLAIVAERMHGRGWASSEDFVAANPDLLDHKATVGRYYDVAAITASPVARAVFVLPGMR